MSVEFYRESPGKFDSRTLSRKTLSRWTGRNGNSPGIIEMIIMIRMIILLIITLIAIEILIISKPRVITAMRERGASPPQQRLPDRRPSYKLTIKTYYQTYV